MVINERGTKEEGDILPLELLRVCAPHRENVKRIWLV